MQKSWLITLGILIVLVIVLIYPLTSIEVQDFRITGLAGADFESGTLEGEISISNPAFITVPVEEVTFQMVLNETGEIISSGTINEFKLEASQVTATGFTQDWNWAPTGTAILDLLTKEHVYFNIELTAKVKLFGFIPYSTNFKDQVDMKEEIGQLVSDNTRLDPETVNQAGASINKIGDSLREQGII